MQQRARDREAHCMTWMRLSTGSGCRQPPPLGTALQASPARHPLARSLRGGGSALLRQQSSLLRPRGARPHKTRAAHLKAPEPTTGSALGPSGPSAHCSRQSSRHRAIVEPRAGHGQPAAPAASGSRAGELRAGVPRGLSAVQPRRPGPGGPAPARAPAGAARRTRCGRGWPAASLRRRAGTLRPSTFCRAERETNVEGRRLQGSAGDENGRSLRPLRPSAPPPRCGPRPGEAAPVHAPDAAPPCRRAPTRRPAPRAARPGPDASTPSPGPSRGRQAATDPRSRRSSARGQTPAPFVASRQRPAPGRLRHPPRGQASRRSRRRIDAPRRPPPPARHRRQASVRPLARMPDAGDRAHRGARGGIRSAQPPGRAAATAAAHGVGPINGPHPRKAAAASLRPALALALGPKMAPPARRARASSCSPARPRGSRGRVRASGPERRRTLRGPHSPSRSCRVDRVARDRRTQASRARSGARRPDQGCCRSCQVCRRRPTGGNAAISSPTKWQTRGRWACFAEFSRRLRQNLEGAGFHERRRTPRAALDALAPSAPRVPRPPPWRPSRAQYVSCPALHSSITSVRCS